MYNYKPLKSIIKEMTVPKIGRYFDIEFSKRNEILNRYGLNNLYILNVIFQEDYAKVNFFSPIKLREIPIRGYLFPAKMFKETILSQ